VTRGGRRARSGCRTGTGDNAAMPEMAQAPRHPSARRTRRRVVPVLAALAVLYLALVPLIGLPVTGPHDRPGAPGRS